MCLSSGGDGGRQSSPVWLCVLYEGPGQHFPWGDEFSRARWWFTQRLQSGAVSSAHTVSHICSQSFILYIVHNCKIEANIRKRDRIRNDPHLRSVYTGISLKLRRSTWMSRTITAQCLQRRKTSKVQTPTTMQNTQMITAQPVNQLYPEILAGPQPLIDICPVYQQTLNPHIRKWKSLFIISLYLFLMECNGLTSLVLKGSPLCWRLYMTKVCSSTCKTWRGGCRLHTFCLYIKHYSAWFESTGRIVSLTTKIISHLQIFKWSWEQM